MPTYEYECTKCERTFDHEQRITDPPLAECPVEECKGSVRRLIPRTSFTLKGAGWFRTGGY
jgi:putative FmdB family regulatory protein